MGPREAPRFPIEPVLESYGATVTSRGQTWAPMACPFHGQDRRPSASVNVSAHRFICHTCMEKSEDAIGLVMWQDGVDFKRAVEICESITGQINGEVRRSPKRGLGELFEESWD